MKPLAEVFAPIGAAALALNIASLIMAIIIFVKLKVTLQRIRNDFHFRLRFITTILLLVNRTSQLMYHIIFFYIESFGYFSDDYIANKDIIFPLLRVNWFLYFIFFATMYAGIVLIVFLTINRYER
jgi:hypothetical protein